MKNKKGFTIVEMLVSFTLSMILVIIMFQLILSLKDLYVTSGIKTELLNKQYIITNKIYSDLNRKKVTKLENCNDPLICVEFTFQDGSTKKLEVNETNKTLSYDNTIIKLNNTSYFKAMNIATYYSALNKKIFNIDIPIYNDSFKDTNFGINIVYPYNDTETINNYGNKYVPPIESYISLPYIKSNGNQYIDLNYAAKTNTEVRLDIELIENDNTELSSVLGNVNIIGRDAITEENAYAVNIAASGSGAQYHIYYWVDKTYASGATTYYKRYTSVTPRSTMTVKSGSATFQNETIEVATKTANNTDKMILLGSFNSDQNKILPFNRYDAKVYGFQIYEGDTLVMNLTPAKSRETEKIGLYDTVSKQFFISNGTADFIYE